MIAFRISLQGITSIIIGNHLTETMLQNVQKLPKIERTRSRDKSRTQNRSSAHLPDIKIDMSSQQPNIKINQISEDKNINTNLILQQLSNNVKEDVIASSLKNKKIINSQQSNKSDLNYSEENFINFIQGKVKLVLEKVNQRRKHTEISQDEDLDFQTVVNQNKAILKQQKVIIDQELNSHKKKPESSKKIFNNKQIKSKSLVKKNIIHNDNLYERNKKSSYDSSVEKKHSKKIQQEKKKGDPIFINLKSGKQYSQPLPIKKESPLKRSQNLFDNLQHFLSNPSQQKAQSWRLQQYSTATLKQLQEKLRAVNAKLGVEQKVEEDDVLQVTLRSWRRLNSKQGFHQSNLQKQIDKISSLQQKNNQSLQQFLNQQKLLVQLVLLKKIANKAVPQQ